MSEPKLTDPVGVWAAIRSLGNYRFSEVIWPEVFFALLIGAGGALAVVLSTRTVDRAAVMGDLVGLAVALLAVTFAALAILVALPASRYLNVLEGTPDGGMRVFLNPFLVAVGAQIAVLLLGVAYHLMAVHVPRQAEHAAFYVLGFLFVFVVLDVASLARQLVKHGIYRAADAASHQQTGGNVRPLEQRRP